MQKTEKERVVAELTAQLRAVDSLIVADYRGLTNSQLEALRARLRPHGARLTIVKNTLTRRAAEAAGADTLLALLEGPTALAFVQAEGDAVAVAKALSDTARETKLLTLRGGIMQGAPITGDDVETFAKLPPLDVLQAQLVGVIVAPLTQLLGLLSAPLTDLARLIDARITQLEESEAETQAPEPQVEAAAAAPEPDAPAPEAGEEDEAAADADAEEESS
jgi:large subunit ribosomal protein L10